ncbi:hypothetical protein Aple_088110 [Acrocarpospora pleiomorpha]|uniref:Uncharacterized protein n=1 Tax=Acrocarpospora pleiomorpha TaxID=90975 RepID=A0A5M3XY17_9ACTN|nr:hypothetical protein [Acrocarpospora pleiomorpha]GES25912.1 hypothetical protein Aple_088110 [Acrocarpospora pleiomorpha]
MPTSILRTKTPAATARLKARHAARRMAMRGFLSIALVTTSAPATASADNDRYEQCGPHRFYKFGQRTPRNFFIPRTRFVDGPGGSMKVSVLREYEVLAYIEFENERQTSITAKDVIRHLRDLERPRVEVRHRIFTGHEYTRKISKGMYGNTWYRVFGYRIGWSAWSVLGTCRHVKIASGIANVPARMEGWHYWETKHPFYKKPEETARPEQPKADEQPSGEDQASATAPPQKPVPKPSHSPMAAIPTRQPASTGTKSPTSQVPFE